MINDFMRKMLFRKNESQNMLIQQLCHIKKKIQFLCFILLMEAIYIFPCIPLLIINEYEELSRLTQAVSVGYILVWFIVFVIFCVIFKDAVEVFLSLVSEKVYFLLVTKKGKALSKRDFRILKEVNENLYKLIETQKCKEFCYYVNFEICKTLKKGELEFIAVKPNQRDDEFIMHMIYINNGWAFDTYSARQYPLEKIYKIYNAKSYKIFDFDQIRNKSYEQFVSQLTK